MPCLIIWYVGSMIGFAGAITAPKPQFEPLTPFFDLKTNEHDHKALLPFARALGAVRGALISLEEEDKKLQGASPPRLTAPFFPFRNYFIGRDDSTVEFEYEARLRKEKLLFRVLRNDTNKKLLLKFTQRYSQDAHEYAASRGIAPELYAVNELGGGWMMVVMDYLDEGTHTLLRGSNIVKQELLAGVHEAVSILHDGGFVHGDIRDVNIMVKSNWNQNEKSKNVKLIDFDWAGEEGSTLYPPNVNFMDIQRPKDARDGLPITRYHDLYMVEHLFLQSTHHIS
ncbi:hypothetical protein CPB86DRAFT_380744 [Serendipita vermifera]|nr:hypothetical protein CPB86DRAFT_380744 [Serendipita vermifera]